jgi:hypothetical protein
LPIALPVLTPQAVVAYEKKLGIVPNTGEIEHTAAFPEYFSDRLGWENLARAVSEVYMHLPTAEREKCVVLGRNYGQAGALEYWSRKYPLPPVYSTHNSYWMWGPPRGDVEVVIVIRDNRDHLEEMFEQVEEGGVAETRYARESRIMIWVCTGLRQPIEALWKANKYFI